MTRRWRCRRPDRRGRTRACRRRLRPAAPVLLVLDERFAQDLQGPGAEPGERRAALAGEPGAAAECVGAGGGHHHSGGQRVGSREPRGPGQGVAGSQERAGAALRALLRLADPPQHASHRLPVRDGNAVADQPGAGGEQHHGSEHAGELEDADVAEVLLGELVGGRRHGQAGHGDDVQQRHVLLPPQPLRPGEIEGTALALAVGQHPGDLRP